MGTPGRKPKRKEVTWSPEIAYAVGLMATDGSLSKNGRHLDLTSKDVEQLMNFMRCVGREILISTKVSSYSNGPVSLVQFSDVTLYNFFLSIGLTPNKTKTMGKIDIPDALFFDFLRGHLDGDGSFYSYFDPRWRSSFMFYLAFVSASKDHVVWLQETIYRLCGATGHITFTGRPGQKIYNIRYAKSASMLILIAMYSNKGVICLSRKRLKIEKALGIVGLSLPQGLNT
jgi:hypothetical protein